MSMKNKPKIIQEIEKVLEDLKAVGLRYFSYKKRPTDVIAYWRVYEIELPAVRARGIKGWLGIKIPTLSLQDIIDKLEQEQNLKIAFPTKKKADYTFPTDSTGSLFNEAELIVTGYHLNSTNG